MKKKMLKNGVVAAVGATMLAVGTTGIVSANNHGDSSWDAILPRNGGNYYTSARVKTDKTRSYVRVKQVGKGHVNVWAQKSDGVEISNPKYKLGPGQSVKMYNRAYEVYGRVKIRLAVESAEKYWVHVHASGVWSPDSV